MKPTLSNPRFVDHLGLDFDGIRVETRICRFFQGRPRAYHDRPHGYAGLVRSGEREDGDIGGGAAPDCAATSGTGSRNIPERSISPPNRCKCPYSRRRRSPPWTCRIPASRAPAPVPSSWSDYPDVTLRRSASLVTAMLCAWYLTARYDAKDVVALIRQAIGVRALASLVVAVGASPSAGKIPPGRPAGAASSPPRTILA